MQTLHDTLASRFDCLDSNEVLSAAGKIMDARDWPQAPADLAAYGNEEIQKLLDHFQEVLVECGCDSGKARREKWPALKVMAKRLPLCNQGPSLWEQLLQDPHRAEPFKNVLCLFEIIHVLPMSTASVKRGFSCMKRVKTDWRATLNSETLSMLMYLSIEGPSADEYKSLVAVQRWWDEGERTKRPQVNV